MIPALALALAIDRAVVVEKNVVAQMRDGVLLRADVYRPEGAGRFPALLQVGHRIRLERADQTLFYDPQRPSRLVLPVVPR